MYAYSYSLSSTGIQYSIRILAALQYLPVLNQRTLPSYILTLFGQCSSTSNRLFLWHFFIFHFPSFLPISSHLFLQFPSTHSYPRSCSTIVKKTANLYPSIFCSIDGSRLIPVLLAVASANERGFYNCRTRIALIFWSFRELTHGYVCSFNQCHSFSDIF